MMLQVALATLLLSAGTMVSGLPSALTDHDEPGENLSSETGSCLVRTYVSNDCQGEQRNPFLWLAKGCKPCTNVVGDFHSISFQGSCPGGAVAFYNESSCAGSHDNILLWGTDGSWNETCYPIDMYQQNALALSVRMCFF